MRTKLTHTIIIVLLSSLCTTISAKDLNPTYCYSIPLQTNGWNEKEAKATLTGIPTDVAKVWVAFALDESWANWADVAATWTPGLTTIVTSRIVPGGTYWKPAAGTWPSGAASYTKSGFVAFCLWSPTNTDAKNQDCTTQIIPCSYDCSSGDCKKNIPTYCTNYRARITADGHSIRLSGLNNNSPGNWFAYSDDGWASYADITPITFPGQNEICIDLSNKTYTSGPKKGKNIEIPLTGTFHLLSDANGLNECIADNNGGNNKNGIDAKTMPIGGGCYTEDKCQDMGGCINSCSSTKVFVSKEMNQLIVVSPKGEIKSVNKNNYTYFDRVNKSTIDFQSQIYASKSDTAMIDLTKSVYTSGPLKDSLLKLPLTDTLKISNSNCENKINLSTVQVWTSIPTPEVHPSVSISPNPATPSETITIKGEYAADAKVIILSASGSIVGNVIPSVGADAMAVSLSELNLQAGIYFIRIESGEKLYSGKLCVK